MSMGVFNYAVMGILGVPDMREVTSAVSKKSAVNVRQKAGSIAYGYAMNASIA